MYGGAARIDRAQAWLEQLCKLARRELPKAAVRHDSDLLFSSSEEAGQRGKGRKVVGTEKGLERTPPFGLRATAYAFDDRVLIVYVSACQVGCVGSAGLAYEGGDCVGITQFVCRIWKLSEVIIG